MDNPIKTVNFTGGYPEKVVLKDLELKLPKGQLSALIGPNGSGKSTFVKYLVKDLKPLPYTLYLENKDITEIKQNENATLISTVNQTNHLPEGFSVFEIVQMGQYNQRINDKNKVLKALKLTHTLKFQNQMINSLSIGQQQMVLLARSICQNTDTIVLDEPFNNLDINHTQLLLKILRDLIKNENKTIFCIMHDLNLVLSYFDYCFLLGKNGKIYCQGKPEETITPESIKSVYNTTVNFIINPGTSKKVIIV
ncbi:MAG: ABC transporter ATP-binding protein [Sphaerochaetaceae bacterium]|nr:ABC transporter ATP-binding protein [Sphaerochaetaceae bacterium]